MNCPGSIRMTEGMENKTSVYAAEGTVAHKLLEGCLRIGSNAIGFLGRVFTEDGFKITVDKEMVDGVQVALDHVWGILAEHNNAQIWVERRDGLEKIKGLKDLREPIYGTTDICIWVPDLGILYIIDFKYGRGVVVEVPGNKQLMIYALAQIIRINVMPKAIWLHVVQPRAHHEDGPIRTHSITSEDLAAFKADMVVAALKTEDPDAPLVAGEWCKFCLAVATCPAQVTRAQEVAQEVFSAIEVSREAAQPLPEPKDLDMERVSFVLAHAGAVEDWFAAVKEHAKNLLNAGVAVPGFKLVRGRSNRRWKDETAAEKALAKAGLKTKQRRVMKVISPAQAEKALKEIGKELSPALVEKPEGALTLAPEADSRPAVMSAQEVFGALPPTPEGES